MRILIVKLGSIGDIVHTLPALAVMRQKLPTAEISWVAEKRSAGILYGNKLIDNLIEVDTAGLRAEAKIDDFLSNLRRQAAGMRKFKFDISLDFQGLLKSAMIAKLSGAKKRWGFAGRALREPASRVFLTDTVKVSGRTHVIQKNLLLLNGALNVDIPTQDFEFPIFTAPADAAEARAIADESGPRFALLNPAGGWPTKLWHAEKYGALADRIWSELGLVCVVVSGPNETELIERVAAAGKSGRIQLSQPSLKGFYELVKRAEVYVGGDTGPTHLAIAAGAPVVGFFGPTEWWRNGSTNPDDLCVERNEIACRVDCHRRACSNWICMDIDVETAFRAVAARIAVGKDRHVEKMQRPQGLTLNGNEV